MTIQISEKQGLALRKYSVPVLRKIGVKDGADYQPHRAEWKILNDHGKEVLKACRSLISTITDDTPEGEARSIEDAYDALLAMHDAIETEKDVRGRLGSRGPRQTDGDIRRPKGDDMTVHPDGFSDEEATQTYALRSGQSMVDHVRSLNRGGEELGDLSVGAYLRAMVTGPKSDVEKRALAEGSDSAGGYTVPDILSARLIDRLRAASVVFRAGAQTVPLGSDVNYVAKVLTDAVPAWRLENAAVAESDPTFGRVTLTARSIAVLVKVSRELLEDSLNMETALPQLLATALALELDRVTLVGTGLAPQPRGVLNFAGLTANAYAGGALTGYAPLIQGRTALRTANSDVTAYIMAPRDEGTLAGLTATDGQPLMVPPAITDVPKLTTTAVPINLGAGTNESIVLAGDWSKLMVGIRSEIRIEVLRERYADTLQYGFLAHLRADVAAEQEAAFTVLDGITP